MVTLSEIETMFYTKQVADEIASVVDSLKREAGRVEADIKGVSQSLGDLYERVAKLEKLATNSIEPATRDFTIRLEAVEKQLSEVLSKPVTAEITEYEQPKRVTENDELEAQKQGA